MKWGLSLLAILLFAIHAQAGETLKPGEGVIKMLYPDGVRSVDARVMQERRPVSRAERTSPLQDVPLADTFKMHSNSNATKTIYLDFDGHTGVWSVTTGYYVSYSFEGTHETFSDNELTEIQKIWQAVADRFLPFNVNVTTEEPPVADLMNTGGGDDRWGIRVVISSSTNEYDYGWAYDDDFRGANDREAFVCADGWGQGYWLPVAATICHETGHTLGLDHDGDSVEEYYDGHYDAENNYWWSPIMGLTWDDTDPGYLYQWSDGEYTDSSNTEDDLNVITTENGFGYMPDDHGSSTSSATLISFDNTNFAFVVDGVIERNTDLDFFWFTTPGAGTIEFNIDPALRGPTLDIEAVIYNSSGTGIHTSSPTTSLDASFNVVLAAGTYYLSIDGTGNGNPTAPTPTGYTDYGSLGSYSIEARGDAELPPPTLGGTVSSNNVVLTWTESGFKVQISTNLVTGPWVDYPGGAPSPVVVPATNDVAFFRLVNQ